MENRIVSSALAGLRRWAGSVAAFGLFLAIAFRHAWACTRGLEWPYDIDLFRDSAFAHSVMMGKFPEDPYYFGAQNWYNPLSALLVAAVSGLFSTGPVHVHAQYGVVIGLAIPVAIFGLAAALFGRWAAVGTGFAFLFLRPEQVPLWVAPTYSPWIFANLLALVPMSLCMVLALRARNTSRFLPWALCGAALGLTFLTHTAAAITAGCVCVAVACTRDWRAFLSRCAALLTTAFVVGLPFAVTILFHYRLHIRNDASLVWLWDETQLANLPSLLRGSLTFPNAVAAWGLVELVRSRSLPGAQRVMLTWLGVAGGLLAYSFLRQSIPHVPLPGLVPPFHWLVQLRVIRVLLFGFSLYSVLVRATRALEPRFRLPVPLAVCVVLFTTLAWNYGRFAGAFDFPAERDVILRYTNTPGFAGATTWLRRHTPTDAVILADPVNSVMIIGAAFRHAVCIDRNFSNPYEPFEDRAAAAAEMQAALAKADESGFRAAAARYGAGYVLLSDVTSPEDPRLAVPFVTVPYARGSYAVLQVK